MVWDTAKFKPTKMLKGHDLGVWSLTYDKTGKKLVSASTAQLDVFYLSTCVLESNVSVPRQLGVLHVRHDHPFFSEVPPPAGVPVAGVSVSAA